MAPPQAIDIAVTAATAAMLDSYVGALSFAATEAYISGQYRASRVLRIPFSFNLVNLEAIARIGNYKHDLITKGGSVIDGKFRPWLSDMGTTARDRVTKVVEEGIRNGTPLKEVSKQLDDVFTAQEHHSQLVAYQETRRLYTQGTMDRYIAEDIQQAEWVHMDPQEHPRPEHQALDGKVFDLDDPVWNELDAFNCHCWARPVIVHGKG